MPKRQRRPDIDRRRIDHPPSIEYMRIATWNVNHRVGKTTYRSDTAQAVRALNAKLVVLTEYFPREHHEQFVADLSNGSGGFKYCIMSQAPPEDARSNRVLIASKVEIVRVEPSKGPTFDRQFASNMACVEVSETGLQILGIRVPYYNKDDSRVKIEKAWNWIEKAATNLRDKPALILGDLNVRTKSNARGGHQFANILDSDWTRMEPQGKGKVKSHFRTDSWSEIDHVLHTSGCRVSGAQYVSRAGSHELAGSTNALSDHSAIVFNCRV